jgi:hypothetical protein
MPDDKVQAYMMGVASTVVDAKKEVIEALELIARHVGGVADARPVQLLALRRYLRLGGTKVHANWAWTPEQAQQFASTGGGKLLANEWTAAALRPGQALPPRLPSPPGSPAPGSPPSGWGAPRT